MNIFVLGTKNYKLSVRDFFNFFCFISFCVFIFVYLEFLGEHFCFRYKNLQTFC